ncbi:MAG: CapA family protein [bacterium]
MKRIILICAFLLALASAAIILAQSKTPEAAKNEIVPKTILITAVGDIVMGNTYPSDNLPQDNGRFLFSPAESLLKEGDIVMGNLECALCDEGVLVKKIVEGKTYAFKTPEKLGINLKNAGFNVLNIANNHIRDFGEGGVKSTMRVLDSLGIKYTGLSGQNAFFEKDSMKIAVIGFSSYSGMNSILDAGKPMQMIRQLSDSNYIVIVTFHGGSEGKNSCHVKDEVEYMYGELRGNIYRFCREAIDAGADAVIGHGPHVPRGIELYKDRIIAYSLGNFLTYAGINISGVTGLAPLLSIELNSDGSFKTGRVYSFKQVRNSGIEIDTLNSAALLMKNLSESDFPENEISIDTIGFILRVGIQTKMEQK